MTAAASDVNPRAVLAQYRSHVNAGMARIYSLLGSPMEVSSEGNYVVTHDGNRYLDCAGYCVFLLGHAHPKVVAAVRDQLERHPMSSRVLPHAQLAAASARLAGVAPAGLPYVWFGSGGAEAVETALKLVRANGRSQLIAMDGGYHGKSLGALSASGRESFRAPFAPLLGGINRVPFGELSPLQAVLSACAAGSCAVLLEPLQSEAGVIVPPAGYLKGVRDLCDRHGALLVVDEISTGLGRTGSFWRCVHDGATPDLLLAGKALGGGVFPVSAVLSTAAAFEPFNREPLLHTSTFSGNPLACAAVLASLDVIEGEGLVERAHSGGAALLAGLREVAARRGGVRDVRGAGMLLGLEFEAEHLAAEFMLEMMSRRILVAHSLFGQRVARLTPPALLTGSEIERVIAAVDESLAVLASRATHYEQELSHA
jgi:putrescine aminotransferase